MRGATILTLYGNTIRDSRGWDSLNNTSAVLIPCKLELTGCRCPISCRAWEWPVLGASDPEFQPCRMERGFSGVHVRVFAMALLLVRILVRPSFPKRFIRQ